MLPKRFSFSIPGRDAAAPQDEHEQRWLLAQLEAIQRQDPLAAGAGDGGRPAPAR